MQTLHQAEQSYSYESDPHEASTWARRGMDNLGPYRYSDPEDYQEAWESTHAGTVTTGESGVSDARFPGGFTVSVEEIITGSPMISCGDVTRV